MSKAERKSYHVISKIGGGWSVHKQGADRASGSYDLKSDAVTRAREMARKDGAELMIHGRDGMIKESTTYGRDSAPVKSRH